jgi:hypothetical protein
MRASKKWFGPMVVLLTVAAIATGCGNGGAETTLEPGVAGGWSLIPINITEDGGMVRVEFAARNDTDGWSAMRPVEDAEKQPTSLVVGGKSYTCENTQIGSGGHYLPPGFQMRGWPDRRGTVQAIFVECPAPEGSLSGALLSIPYIFATGEYDYYEKGENIHEAQLEVEIDPEQSPPDLTYPVAGSLEVEVYPLTEPIVALNDCTLTLVDATRTDEGFFMKWTIYNPGEYNTLVHIGRPPAVGEDGIVYSTWISPDRVEVPIAKPSETAEFETESLVPPDVVTPYMLLMVEQTRERLWTNYLVDLSGVE